MIEIRSDSDTAHPTPNFTWGGVKYVEIWLLRHSSFETQQRT